MIGYKCFEKGLINRYGKQFEVGKKYHTEGEVRFGFEGGGYHMCEKMEDTLRYFDAMNHEVDICLVEGSGNTASGYDTYYDYYNMYSVEYLEILEKLSREEIIEYALNLSPMRVKRFIFSFRLTYPEIEMFKEKFAYDTEVLDCIAYYQEGNKDVFEQKVKAYSRLRKK